MQSASVMGSEYGRLRVVEGGGSFDNRAEAVAVDVDVGDAGRVSNLFSILASRKGNPRHLFSSTHRPPAQDFRRLLIVVKTSFK